MLKYIFLTLLLIAAALLWMTYGIGVSSVASVSLPPPSTPHVAQNPERSIEKIHLYALYFVPREKQEKSAPDWRTRLEESLENVEQFHELQFRGLSQLAYSVYPAPIIGKEESFFYDTATTDRGNPHALIRISEELEERVFGSGGDLYNVEFIRKEEGAYPVLFILYEGVGASGGIIYESEFGTAEEIAMSLGVPEPMIFVLDVEAVDGFFLLNREFLGGALGVFGESILAHEFYHTLGISDSYTEPDGAPTSDDIMGRGRERPLEKTYIRQEVLEEMGI